MKHATLFLLLALLAGTSCHKSHSSSPVITNSFPVNGVTGVRLKMTYDSSGPPYSAKYVTWSFSGTNPLVATPSDTVNFKSIEMYFTGRNATKVVYHGYSFYADTLTISYNSQNLPDTIITNTPSSLPLGHWAYCLQYNDTTISKVTAVGSATFPVDTFRWASPKAIYYYSFSEKELAAQISYDGGSGYTDTIRYTTGSIKNNLSGSIPLYLLLEFISSISNMGSGTQIPDQLPFYVGSHAISALTGATPNAFNYITDSKGRITERIAPGATTFDTTTFYY